MKLYRTYAINNSGKHELQAIGSLSDCIREYNRLVDLHKQCGCVARPGLKSKLVAPNAWHSVPSDIRGNQIKRWSVLCQASRCYEVYIVEAGEL